MFRHTANFLWNEGAGSQFAGVHFRSAVLESLLVIEREATATDPSLKTKPPERVRAFLDRIQQRCPGLRDDTIAFYEHYYELASNGNDSESVTEADYTEFVNVYLDINRVISKARN